MPIIFFNRRIASFINWCIKLDFNITGYLSELIDLLHIIDRFKDFTNEIYVTIMNL